MRKKMSHKPEEDSAAIMEEKASMIIPIAKILFLPFMSASLPKGTRNIAAARR